MNALRIDLTERNIGLFTITEEEVPKWQYQREEFLQQEEIKDVQAFGKWTLLNSQNAQNAANIQDHTECVKPAVTITADRL